MIQKTSWLTKSNKKPPATVTDLAKTSSQCAYNLLGATINENRTSSTNKDSPEETIEDAPALPTLTEATIREVNSNNLELINPKTESSRPSPRLFCFPRPNKVQVITVTSAEDETLHLRDEVTIPRINASNSKLCLLM